MKLTNSILYLIFNKLDFVKNISRDSKEKRKTDAVRKYILDNINWECDVKTLFRNKNLGCKYAVSGAIDWFFENVEQGIILEDDCLPDPSFFRFCQEMLKEYRNR